MPLSYFTVTGNILAAVTDSSADAGGEPDTKPISCSTIFTPKPQRVREAGNVYFLQPIRSRTNLTTGQIETIDGNPVELVDSVGLDVETLEYTLSFEDIVVPSAHGAKISLTAMVFEAPGDGSTIDLGTVLP